jgi:hypothetical protein
LHVSTSPPEHWFAPGVHTAGNPHEHAPHSQLAAHGNREAPGNGCGRPEDEVSRRDPKLIVTNGRSVRFSVVRRTEKFSGRRSK